MMEWECSECDLLKSPKVFSQSEVIVLIEQAHMAGQFNAGVDPNYSEARVYSNKINSLKDKD